MPTQLKPVIGVVCVLLLAMLACNAPVPSSPLPTVDVNAAVVATLTAFAPTALPPVESSPLPSDTVAPLASPTMAVPTSVAATSAPASPTPLPLPEFVHVVYIVDGDIFLWTEGGVPNQLTFNGDAVDVLLSDDASVVVFVRSIDSVHNEIWAINSNGTNERLLVSQQEFAAELDLPGALAVVPHKIAWAPGRRLLAYNTRYVFDGPGLMQRGDLNLVNADTLEKSQLLPPGAAGSGDDFVYEPGMAGEFLYSPDGGQIALSTPNSISLMAADGSNLLPDILQYEVVITYSEYAYHARPRWALDGGALRVMIPPEDPLAEPPPDTTLWHIPSDGSPATPLSSFPVSPFYFAQGSGHPISPDLNRFAYLHDAGGGANELHLADVDGSNDVVYVTGQLLKFHGWAPDSQRFAYSVGDSPPMLGQVGAAPLPLTDVTTQAGALVWVDDGKVLFVNISQPVELRLGVVGGVSTVIDYFAAGDALPQFDFTQ